MLRVLLLIFILFSSISSAAIPLKEKSGINLDDLNYATRENNEEAQTLPIPTRINEIIYPTIGFPSLIKRGQNFSIILQLPREIQENLSKNAHRAQYEIYLTSGYREPPQKEIPRGFDKKYASYFDFIEHQPGGEEYFISFLYMEKLKPERMNFSIAAQLVKSEFFQDKLIITAKMPQDIPREFSRGLDLELKITVQGQVLLHDKQYHCMGLLEDKEKYRFIHMADPQINNLDFNLNGPTFHHHEDLATQAFALYQAIEEMNFINPDFALMSGDLVDGGNSYYNVGGMTALFTGFDLIFGPYTETKDYHLGSSSYWNEYSSIIKFIRQLNFPVFSATGNHDGYASYEKMNTSKTVKDVEYSGVRMGQEEQKVIFDGKQFWRKMMGPLSYSFDFGIWHFVIMDTFDLERFFRLSYSNFASNNGGWVSKEQLSWLETDFKAATDRGQKIILVGHHDPRGGAKGMFYDDERYRFPRRKVLKLDDELWHHLKQYKENTLYAAQEWAGVKTEINSPTIDLHFDSAKELLNLIAHYNITHVFLGHVHADYKDIVELGGRKIQFIHTTALAAQAYKARSYEEPNHRDPEGEGEGIDAHWGYRIFELDQKGNLSEIERPNQASLNLGNLRINVGRKENYRRQVAGLISAKRPFAKWLPFGNFLAKLDKNKTLPWLFAHLDPMLLFHAIFDSSLYQNAAELYRTSEWTDDMKKDFKSKLDNLFVKTDDYIGLSHKSHKIFISNQNEIPLDGVLEFNSAFQFKTGAQAKLYTEDDAELKLNEIGSMPVKVMQFSVGGPRWTNIPLTLPGSPQKPVYLDLRLE
ncbi:MAG TPA: metallophosphoesterase [Bdellovibrionota bacterium]|nr:metallophosphoesterase [Bdellovibrionota bacterium]